MSGTDWIAKLKVKELQDELRARGLTVSGKKADLAERLKAAVEAEEQAADVPAEDSNQAAAAPVEAPDEAATAADDATEQAIGTAEVAEAAEPHQMAVGEPDQQPDSTQGVPEQQASADALEEEAPADEGYAGMKEAPEVAVLSTHPETAAPSAAEDADAAAAAEPAVAADAEVEADMPPSPVHKQPTAESEPEEVLDFEGTPGLEAQMAMEPEAQQQQQQQDGEGADADMQGAGVEGEQQEDPAPAAHQAPGPPHKRSSPDPAPASRGTPAVEYAVQQEQKRAKYAPIPAPEQCHKAAGNTTAQPPTAQSAGDLERRSGTPAEAAGSGAERKRKHEPIPIPSKAPAAKPLRHSGSGLSSEGAAAAVQGEPAPTPDQEQQVAEAVAAAGEVPADATAALVINGLKRPYTPQALTQLLSETGFVQGVFLTKLKDRAYVVFKEASQAHATRTKLQGVTWPPASRSQLQLSFIAEDLAASVIKSQQAPTEGVLQRALSSGGASSGLKGAAGAGAVPAAAAARRTAPDVDAASEGAEGEPERTAAAAGGRGKPSVLDRLGGRGEPDAAEQADVDPSLQPAAAPTEDEPLTLDDLFRKTTTKPHLYFLPLTDEQVAAKKARTAAAAPAGGGGGRAGGAD